MGYFEPYCLACGGPCSGDDDLQDMYDDSESRNEKVKLKKLINALERLRDRRWLSQWVVVCRQGTYRGPLDGDYPNGMDADDVEAVDDQSKPVAAWDDKDFDGHGAPWMGGHVYGFHEACWNVVGRPTWEALEVLHLRRDEHNNTLLDESVYVFNGRMGQDFEWHELQLNEVKWLENPMIDAACAQHVKDSWERVKRVVKKNASDVVPAAAVADTPEIVAQTGATD